MWDNCLEFIAKQSALKQSLSNEKTAENLLCYFIFRHLSSACDRDDIKCRLAFAVLSCSLIFTLADTMSVEEAARMYSGEIEYSDENLNALFDMLRD